MKVRIEIPGDAFQASLVARFKNSATRKTIVFLVEFRGPDDKPIVLDQLGWSETLQSNFVYCPSVPGPAWRSLATIEVPDGAASVVVKVAPWRVDSTVLSSLEGLHACVTLRDSPLKITCAGVAE